MEPPSSQQPDLRETTHEHPNTPTLDADTIAAFFADKWKINTCEVCNLQNTWQTAAPDSRYVVVSSLGDGEIIKQVSPKVYVSLIVMCSNCGNLKLLALNAIMKWLQDRSKP